MLLGERKITQGIGICLVLQVPLERGVCTIPVVELVPDGLTYVSCSFLVVTLSKYIVGVTCPDVSLSLVSMKCSFLGSDLE
jgi:hypothetical protein